jgi:hypothetical protein
MATAQMGLTVGPTPSRRRPAAAVAVLLAATVAAAGFAWGRHHTPDTDSDAGPAVAAPVLTWASDGPWPVPRSATEGPTRLSEGSSGVPVGYAHDALGAALAAFNISEQLTSDVGPVIAAVTARTQTFGDPSGTLAMVQTSPTGGATPATDLLYAIVGGDPGGDRVVVAIAERSPTSNAHGGVYVSDRELRWIDGDWRMGLPMSGAVIVPTSELGRFTSLGGPHV